MITASDAILSAAGFLGFGAAGFSAKPPLPDPVADPIFEADASPSPDLLSPGEPYFEAVAAELRKTGYLNS